MNSHSSSPFDLALAAHDQYRKALAAGTRQMQALLDLSGAMKTLPEETFDRIFPALEALKNVLLDDELEELSPKLHAVIEACASAEGIRPNDVPEMRVDVIITHTEAHAPQARRLMP